MARPLRVPKITNSGPRGRKKVNRTAQPSIKLYHRTATESTSISCAEQMVSALTRSRGMVTIAAQLLGCNRQTIYNTAKQYPEVKDAIDGQRELGLDTAELKLLEAINKGQAWAICFYLKTQGKKRGYIEKTDIGLEAQTLEELVLLSLKRPARRKPGC